LPLQPVVGEVQGHMDPSLFPCQSQGAGNSYDRFTSPSLLLQPFVGEVQGHMDPFPFPYQSKVQGDPYTNTPTHAFLPRQPFVAADVQAHPGSSSFPYQLKVQGDAYTNTFTHPSLQPQPFVDLPSSQFAVKEGQWDPEAGNPIYPRSDPRHLLRYALSQIQSMAQGNTTNASPSLERAVSPFQPFNHSQGDLAMGTLASTASDLVPRDTISPEFGGGMERATWTRANETKRATRTRAANKEDQGGRCHKWADLLAQHPPTHDALRWAQQSLDIHTIRDIFPSRQAQHINLTVIVGIDLYASENGVRIGGLPLFDFSYPLMQILLFRTFH